MKLRSSNKIETNRWELEIEIEPQVFCQEVDKVYNRKKNKIMVPGFRKGKAPRTFIEKYYGEGIFFEDAINAVYPSAVEDAAKEAGIELVNDHVDFDVVKMSKSDGLIFKVKVTVMPDVKVENYKGIEIKKIVIPAVTEDDINEEIEKVRDKSARLVDCDSGVAEKGDISNIDFEGSVDGEPFEGGAAEDVDLELGGGQFVPGFEDQIIGKNVGDEFDITVVFPDDYHVSKLASKTAVFKTKLNKLQKKQLPELDDEFVKDVSEFDTLDEYKADLEKKLAASKEEEAKAAADSETFDKFVELVEVEIPEALIRAKTKILLREFEQRFSSLGIKLKDYVKYTGISEEKLASDMRPRAVQSVKMDLGIKRVGELENVTVSDEEVEAEYGKIAEGYKLAPEQIKRFIAKDDIVSDITRQKVLDIIRNNRVEK